jgi:hypothetical protein
MSPPTSSAPALFRIKDKHLEEARSIFVENGAPAWREESHEDGSITFHFKILEGKPLIGILKSLPPHFFVIQGIVI